MNVYAVKWKQANAGPLVSDGHGDYRYTDLTGVDIVTCTNDRMAHHYVNLARPEAQVERPRLLGPA